MRFQLKGCKAVVSTVKSVDMLGLDNARGTCYQYGISYVNFCRCCYVMEQLILVKAGLKGSSKRFNTIAGCSKPVVQLSYLV